MSVQTLHDKFVYHLQQMYHVENRLVDVLDELAAEATNDDLREAFEEHREETKQHVTRLEDVFDAVDEVPEERPSPAFDGLLEEREQFFEDTDADEDMRDLHELTAAVTNEYLEIASYEALVQLARKLDLPRDVRDTLDQNLDEEQRTKKQLKSLGEDSTVTEVFTRLAG
jgi:ferritin-like metal-binding protein YciE